MSSKCLKLTSWSITIQMLPEERRSEVVIGENVVINSMIKLNHIY